MPLPSPSIFSPKRRESHEPIIIPIVSEILLVCAAVLWFLVYFQMPIEYATAGMLFALIFGSFLCWKSPLAAEAILYVSLFMTQYVLALRFGVLIIPFILLDMAVVWLVTRSRRSQE